MATPTLSMPKAMALGWPSTSSSISSSTLWTTDTHNGWSAHDSWPIRFSMPELNKEYHDDCEGQSVNDTFLRPNPMDDALAIPLGECS